MTQVLIGGLLLGFSAAALFWLNGRIAGISGIVSRLFFDSPHDYLARLAFLFGLILVGVIAHSSGHLDYTPAITSHALMGLAGLLVGIGTVMSNGCTSGHGICGIARLSKRSFVATLIFIFVGMIVVYLTRHLIHVPL